MTTRSDIPHYHWPTTDVPCLCWLPPYGVYPRVIFHYGPLVGPLHGTWAVHFSPGNTRLRMTLREALYEAGHTAWVDRTFGPDDGQPALTEIEQAQRQRTT